MGLIQSKQGAATASPLNITLDNPTGTGHGLVVMVTASGTTANGTVSGITLGGSAGNFASAASIGGSADASITACWLDLNCASGQTAVSISFTGGSGTQQFFAAVYEFDNLLTASAFDKSSGNASTISWTSNATATTSQASEVFVGAVFITGASAQPSITGPSSPWANLTQQTATQGSFFDAWMSGWQAVSSTQTATYSGTTTNGTDGTALVVTLKATSGTAPPDLPQIAPGPAWLARFKPSWPKPHPPMAEPAGPAAFIPNKSDLQFLPGPTWLSRFKPGVPRPRPVTPPPGPPAVNATGGLALAPLAFTAQGGQTAPDQPSVQPGPTWFDLFRPWVQRPRPPAPPSGPANVNASGSLTLAPLAFTGSGAQSSPDQPEIQPGPAWWRLFRPWSARPRPFSPDAPQVTAGVTATGSLALAPLALSGTGSQTSPDVPQASPGPVWSRLFRPWAPRPLPPPPAVQNVSVSGSLTLAPVAFAGQGSQTSPDIGQVSPGPLWLRLFRPQSARPVPPPPALQAVNASGSLALAPLGFTAQGGQSSPDVEQVRPGPVWQRLFRPWQQRPVPPPPAVQAVNASGSFSLAPVALTAAAGQTSPDIPQAQPGSFWLRLFRPQAPKPLPPQPAAQAVNGTGSFSLAPLAFTAQGAQTSPDQPQVQPGPMWLRLLRPQVRRPLLPPPAQQPVTSSGSLSLAPLAFTGSTTPPLQDQLQVSPGPAWLRFFKPQVPRPVPPVPPPFLPPAATCTGSLALAPVAFTGQAGQSSPDATQAQPGPLWLRLFRPQVRRPLPPPPATPAVSTAGGLTLAPLTLAGQAGQTSPDVPQAQPGPSWLRFFRPWLRKPVPPPPATPAVNTAGTLTLAPLALSGTGTAAGGGPRDLPAIQPGPVWQRLFRPWIPKRVPPPPAAPAAAAPVNRILITAGDPFTLWATGSPVVLWDTGDPYTLQETGTPFLLWETDDPVTLDETGTPYTG